MTDFGQLVLVLGDLHIPVRPPSTIPAKFLDLLIPGLCTGNVGNANTLQYIQSLANNVYIARNELDCHTATEKSQNNQTITIGEFTFLLYNNYSNSILCNTDNTIDYDQCIYELCKYNSDIILLGNTHTSTITEYCNKLIVSPGTLTGGKSPLHNDDETVPSFILIAVKGAKAVVYTYEIHNGEVSVTKTEHIKHK